MNDSLLRFGLGLLALGSGTVALTRWAGLGVGWLPLAALIRAVVQLCVIAVLLRGILAAPWTVVGFAVLMLTTASWTSGQRLRELRHGRRIALVGVLIGAAVSVGAVFALQLVQPSTRYFVAVAGILIGNAMSAATLSGRNFIRACATRAGELEAWLALGATPVQAHREIATQSARETLLPNLDQTKSTGLVTLPGAFVGALFGGASPVAAAQFQLVVLAGIGLTITVTSLVVTRLASATPYLVGWPDQGDPGGRVATG